MKDTKFRSCLITCMSQALYPLYRIRMGPIGVQFIPSKQKEQKPLPLSTPYWVIQIMLFNFKKIMTTLHHICLRIKIEIKRMC